LKGQIINDYVYVKVIIMRSKCNPKVKYLLFKIYRIFLQDSDNSSLSGSTFPSHNFNIRFKSK